MTPQSTAAAARWPVRELDAAWSTSPRTLRRARLLELSGWAFFVAGRAGVLGDSARPDMVAASLGLLAPDAVRAGWEAACKVGPVEVAASRLAECARWGDEQLSELSSIEALTALSQRVVDAADAAAMPIFAAARSMPVPDGGPGGRAAILVHLLHEHRTGAMLVAARACGLTAVETLIAGPDGEQEAITFGWQPPFPPRVPLLRRYIYAETIADRICGQAYGVLSAAERINLVWLLEAAARAGRPT